MADIDEFLKIMQKKRPVIDNRSHLEFIRINPTAGKMLENMAKRMNVSRSKLASYTIWLFNKEFQKWLDNPEAREFIIGGCNEDIGT